MIVIGTDAHKRSHTCQAVGAATGEQLGCETVKATTGGHVWLLEWARELGDGPRVWAIEDCRSVSGRLERFLLARGERVVRVPPKLTVSHRRGSREAGKSDPIDALAVARAALQEGVDSLPVAVLDGPAREIKLLLDHREDLIGERVRTQCRLRELLHDRWPEFDPPASCLDRTIWLERIARKLARSPQHADVRVMRSHVRRLRELAREANALERELAGLVADQQPRLLELPGVGALTAAKLITEIAGIERFSSPAKLARLAGIAPIPASSGAHHRHRLDRGGNRQLNAAVYRVAITQLRHEPRAQKYVERKLQEGKTKREALRCLKRQLIRTIYNTMTPTDPAKLTYAGRGVHRAESVSQPSPFEPPLACWRAARPPPRS